MSGEGGENIRIERFEFRGDRGVDNRFKDRKGVPFNVSTNNYISRRVKLRNADSGVNNKREAIGRIRQGTYVFYAEGGSILAGGEGRDDNTIRSRATIHDCDGDIIAEFRG